MLCNAVSSGARHTDDPGTQAGLSACWRVCLDYPRRALEMLMSSGAAGDRLRRRVLRYKPPRVTAVLAPRPRVVARARYIQLCTRCMLAPGARGARPGGAQQSRTSLECTRLQALAVARIAAPLASAAPFVAHQIYRVYRSCSNVRGAQRGRERERERARERESQRERARERERESQRAREPEREVALCGLSQKLLYLDWQCRRPAPLTGSWLESNASESLPASSSVAGDG